MNRSSIEALVVEALRSANCLNLLGASRYTPSGFIHMRGRYNCDEIEPPQLDDLTLESFDRFRTAYQAYQTEVMKRRKEKEDQVQAMLEEMGALRASPKPQEQMLQKLNGLRDLGVNLEMKVDAPRVYSELKLMKAHAKSAVKNRVPGARQVYFIMADDSLRSAKRFRFFRPRGIYQGQISLDLVAQDSSRSYAVVPDARANFEQAKASILGYFSAAHEYFRAGDFKNAAANFEKILEIEPYPHVHKFVGDCYRHLGENKKAVQHYRQAIKNDVAGEAVAELHLRKKLWSSRASRWFGWLGGAGNAIGNAYERIERGDRILRERYARA